jgi:hypothetical protein
VFLPEALLDGVKLTGHAETFDGRYFMSVGHDGEHGARLHGQAVHEYGAHTAVRRIAADVRAGQATNFPKEVGQQDARLDIDRNRFPVHHDVNSSLFHAAS